MAKSYEAVVDHVIDLVGGKENVELFQHCATRLRFKVKNRRAIDEGRVGELAGVLGTQWVGDQFQVIIGQNVGTVYEAICDRYGFAKAEEVADDAPDAASGPLGYLRSFRDLSPLDAAKRLFSSFVGLITDSIMPLIPMLIAAGLIKCVVLIGEQLGWLTPEMSTDRVLTFCSDAAFYFMPVMVGATAARRFKCNIGLGLLLGALLIHPSFVAMVAEEGGIDVFGLPVAKLTYTSQFFPTILSVWALAHVERFFKKISPAWISALSVPLLSMLVMIPVTLCALAPLGYTAGELFSQLTFFLQDHLGFLFMGIMATIIPFLILTGMHRVFVPYRAQQVATVGYDPFVTNMNFVSNVNMGIACLAVALKAKTAALRATAISCAANCLLAGITEPAMFGIVFKLKTPLIPVLIGNFVGGCYLGLTQTYCYAIGRSVIWGLPAYVAPDNPMNLPNMLIALGIGIVVTFVLSLVIYRDTSAGTPAADDAAERVATSLAA